MAPVFRDLNSELCEDSQFNYETIQIYYYLTSDIINVAHVTAFTITVFSEQWKFNWSKRGRKKLSSFPVKSIITVLDLKEVLRIRPKVGISVSIPFSIETL